MSVPGQNEFDYLVFELVQQGSAWEDACAEILATFTESHLDVNGLYTYKSRAEWDEKIIIDKRITTLLKCAEGEETFVNASFAIQGLMQAISRGENSRRGTLLLAESRGLFHILFKISIKLACNNDMHDTDSDEEEEDEEILQKLTVLEFIMLLVKNSTHFSNFHAMILILNEEASGLKFVLESHSDDERLSLLTLEFLLILVSFRENRELIKDVGITSELDLVRKMHNKSSSIGLKVQECLGYLA